MTIKETLQLESKIAASFNSENDPKKAHIITYMCLATNTADTVASFAQSSNSFGELCRNYLHYVPNGIAESSIIYYLVDKCACYVASDMLITSKVSENFAVNESETYIVRVLDFTYKDYLDKYYRKILSVVGDNYLVNIVASPFDEIIQIGRGNSISIWEKNNEFFIVCE